MKKCPACHHEVDDEAVECPSCGVIFAKWEVHHAGSPPASPPPEAAVPPAPAAEEVPPEAENEAASVPASEQIVEETVRVASGKGLYILLAILAAAGVLVYFLLLRGSSGSPGQAFGRSGTSASAFTGPCPSLGAGDEFERLFPVPGEPQGLAWGDGAFLVGNRVSPWGFVRIECDGDTRKVTVKSPTSEQTLNVWCLCFNGLEYVSAADGRWVGATTPDAFLVHDPKSLKILRHFPAPPKIGGLTWDGEYYWAATRKNTKDEEGKAYLYKLDARFNEVQKWESPVVGCQGLCWAQGLLFWADVFTDQIVIFKIEEDRLVKVHAYKDATNYLSGIAFDGSDLWVTEYQMNRLRMLPRRLTSGWFAGDFRVPHFQACRVARVLLAFDQGAPEALQALRDHWEKTTPSAQELHVMCDALDSLGVRGPMVKAIDAVLMSTTHQELREALAREREYWQGPLPPD